MTVEPTPSRVSDEQIAAALERLAGHQGETIDVQCAFLGAVLREMQARRAAEAAPTTLSDTGTLRWKGRRFSLSPMQTRMVRALLDASGEPVTYRALHTAAYGREIPLAHHEMTMRAQIRRIRSRLGEGCPIINHTGVGYSWQEGAQQTDGGHLDDR
jgi:DNA-binding response OmpR family regulator